ncbi:ABC transporter ATP-binding protein [Crocosphaera sp. Alani8]|uniref:ABC transporter ATP-binding protein n=1 Tax=Crocosphaera sp. Alani8 TaxID=3038952 RepID=UPI00313CF099
MLVIQELNKTYNNGIRAIENISLTIEPGIFGLLGPNGAGKSSLMRTLATLQDADSGLVTLDGVDIFEDPQKTRRWLGYLPQDFGVYPNVSAEELLDLLAVFKGFVKARQRRDMVAYQLQLVNLYEKRKQKLGTFSGGMRQRFGIAQALLGEPKLVIVDEPMAGLDPTERIRFQNLLAEISKDRVLILSTHIVEDVASLCPQMAILNQGKIVTQGSPFELMEQLHGKVWMKVMSPTEAGNMKEELTVITARMRQGKRYVRIFSETAPDEGFDEVEPELNDVYFSALASKKDILAKAKT